MSARERRRKKREQWFRCWSLGRFEFEVEWCPRARYYTFSLTVNTPVAWGVEHGILDASASFPGETPQ